MKFRNHLVVTVLTAVMAGGCASGSGNDAPGGPEAIKLNASERAEVKAMRSPDPNDAETHKQQRIQLTTDCMKQQGFADYVFPTNFYPREVGADPDLPVAQYGFGLSTRLEEAYGPEEIDPYYDRLSASEKKAYDTAWGKCTGEVAKKLGPPPDQLSPSSAKALEKSQKRALNDQRFVDANKKWSACMTGEGYQYATRADLFNALGKRVQPFVKAYIDAAQGVQDGAKAPKLEKVFSPDQMKQLVTLQDDERKAALADEKCAGKDVSRLQATITDEYLDKLEKDGE